MTEEKFRRKIRSKIRRAKEELHIAELYLAMGSDTFALGRMKEAKHIMEEPL